MTSQAGFAQPPRIANWLVILFATGQEAESISGDMHEEFSQLASRSGSVFARRWYWRQTHKTVAHLFTNSFRVAPWLLVATVFGGFLLERLAFGLPERATFAVLERYEVFDHHFSVYLFFATYGIAVGHVIMSLFVGCAVALAAKGREMVATITLAFVFCAMTGVALVWMMATGHAWVLRMLPWDAADWLAIVVGGAMVRIRRSGATPLPSNA